jgi:hypothetical protein
MKRFIFYSVILFAFVSTQINAQNARASNNLAELQNKFNGIWEINGIGSVMYYNLVKINVVNSNKLTIEVLKNTTTAKESGGKVTVVSFSADRIVLQLQAGKYWTLRGNIALSYEENIYVHYGKGETFMGQVTLSRKEDDTPATVEPETTTQTSEENYRSFLEAYCQRYYSDCFSGRKYVSYSLSIIKIDVIGGGIVKINRRHSYKGSYGRTYDDMDFYAYITLNTSDVAVEFHKKAQADFFHSSDYWEECTKRIEK